MGAWGNGRGAELDEKLFRHHVVSMATRGGIVFHAGLPQPHAVPGSVAGAWMGTRAVWAGVAVDVLHLCRDVDALVGGALLFFAASGEHDFVCVHDAAIDDPHSVEGRSGVAGD